MGRGPGFWWRSLAFASLHVTLLELAQWVFWKLGQPADNLATCQVLSGISVYPTFWRRGPPSIPVPEGPPLYHRAFHTVTSSSSPACPLPPFPTAFPEAVSLAGRQALLCPHAPPPESVQDQLTLSAWLHCCPSSRLWSSAVL